MKRHSNSQMDWERLREQIIGLDEQSVRKSYYPELQRRLAELEKFRALLDQSNEAVFLVSLTDGRMDDVNESAGRQLGYTRKELLALPLSALIVDERYSELSTYISELAEPGAAKIVTTPLRCRDGNTFPAELSLRRVTFEQEEYLMIVAHNITRRQQAQRALEESETRYRALVEQLPVGVYTAALDEIRSTLYMSPQIELLTGFTPEEYMAHPGLWSQQLHPDDRERVLAEIGRSNADLTAFNCEYRMITRDGRSVWFRDEATVIRTSDEQPRFRQGVMIDITARKQAEEALRESEARYRALIEQASDAIFLETEDDEIIDVNQKACQLLGYTREELLQLKVADLIAPETHRPTQNILRDELEHHADRPFESLDRHRDGHTIPVEVTVTRLTGQEKPLVLAIVRDITERKRAAEEIRQLSEFNEGIIQNVAEGIVIEDAEGYYTFANPAAAAMLGYPAEQLIGMHRAMFIPADQWPLVLLADEQHKRGLSDRYQMEILRQDSTRLPIQISSRPLYKAGKFAGTLSVLTNIQEQVLAEQEKSRSLERMEQQRLALLQLSTHTALVEGRLAEAFPFIAQTVAQTLKVARVTIWQLGDDGETLYCRGYYQPADLPQPDEKPLRFSQYPLYAAALRSGLVLETSDVRSDPRTAELNADYWEPSGITATVETPIWLHGQVVGIICYEHIGTSRIWIPDEVTFTIQVAALIAQALLNSELQRQAEELVTITRISQEITSLHDLSQVLTSIALHAAQLSQGDACGVFLSQPDGSLRIMASHGVRKPFFQALQRQPVWPGQGTVGQAVAEKKPVQTSNVQTLTEYPFSYPAELEQIHAILAVPLLRGETAIGGMVIWHRQPRHFTPHEISTLQALAQQCVNAVENAQLITAERVARTQAEALYRTSRTLGAATNPVEMLKSVTELAGWLDFTACSLLHFTQLDQEQTPRDGVLYILVRAGTQWQALPPWDPVPITSLETVRRLMQEPDYVLSHADLEPLKTHLPPALAAAVQAIGIQTTLTIGLDLHGRPVGMITLSSSTPDYQFPAEAGRWLRTIADQMAVALENQRLLAETQRAATQTKALYETSRALSSSLNEETLMRTILQAAYETLGYEYVLIATVDETTHTINHRHMIWQGQFNVFPEWLHLGHYPLDHPDIIADVYRTGQTEIIDQWDERFNRAIWEQFGHERFVRIFTPIRMRDRVVGVIEAGHDKQTRRTIEPPEVQMLTAFADQIAVALENARLFTSLTQETRRLELLYSITRQLASTTTLAEVVRTAVDAAPAIGAEYGDLILLDLEGAPYLCSTIPGRTDLTPAQARRFVEILTTGGLQSWVLREQRTTLVHNTEEDPRWLLMTDFPASRTVHSAVAVPLLNRNGMNIGVLTYFHTQQHAFGIEEQRLAEEVAARVEVALENVQLFQAEQRRRQEAETLRAAALALTTELNRNQVIERILAQLQTVVPYDSASVQLLKEDRLQIVGGRGFPNLPELLGITFPLEEDNPNREVITSRQPFIVADGPALYAGFHREPHVQANIHSWLGVPMLVGEHLIGMIALDKHEPGFYTPDHARLAEAFAAQAAIAMHNSHMFSEIQQRVEELAALHESAVALASALDVDTVLYTLAERMGTVLDVTSVYISDWNPEDNSSRVLAEWWGAAATGPERQSDLGRTYLMDDYPEALQVMQERRHVLLQRADPQLSAAHRAEALKYGWHSALIVPLVIRDVAVGYAELWESRHKRLFTPDEIRLCQTLAADAAAALEHARLFQAEREQHRLAEALAEAAAAITSSLDRNTVLERILEQVARVVPGDAFQIMQLGEDQIARTIGYHSNREVRLSTASLERFWQPVAEYHNLAAMARTGQPYLIEDTATDPDWQVMPDTEWVRSQVAAPIQIMDRLLGFLKVDGKRPHQFGPTDVQRLAIFAQQAAIALQNAELFESLELKVQERTAEIQAQLARLQAVLESTLDGIIVTDQQGEILTANPVAQAWLEQELSPDEAVRLRRMIHDLALQADQRPDRELEFKDLDLQLTAAPIVGHETGEARAVVAVHDISYLKTLDRMKSRFISNVSHELRSPITTIKLNAALMRRNPARWEEYLAPLNMEVDRLMRLVENVLQISRMEAGRLEKQPRPTSLNTLVTTVVESHQVLASTQRLTLEYHPAPTDLTILVDPNQIMQALNNLVENALRYTLEGQVKVLTGKAEWAGQAWVTITVSDTGIGIPEEEIPNIFDRFYRGEAVRHGQIPGSGLGLAIVREFVELNGGRITVESKVGVGSAFTIWLPLSPVGMAVS